MLLFVERCVTVSLFLLALPFFIIKEPVGHRKSDGRQDPRAAALGSFSCERSLPNRKECEKNALHCDTKTKPKNGTQTPRKKFSFASFSFSKEKGNKS